MGGPGSGRKYGWGGGGKSTTEGQRRIDIRWLKKHGGLKPGIAGNIFWSRSWACGSEKTGSVGYRMEADRMILFYSHRVNDGEWEDVEQVVHLDQTPCFFGGQRKWFLCPSCSKRVALLYNAGKYFFCRHCLGLAYSSQQEPEEDRMMRKARKIRERLGASNNLTEPILFKPKGMHQKTFDRLRYEAEEANKRALWIMGQKIGLGLDAL